MKRKSIVTQTVKRVSAVYISVMILLALSFTFYIATYMKDNILDSQKASVDTAVSFTESSLENMIGPIISLAEYTPTARLVTGYYPLYSPEWMESIRNIDAYLQNVNMFTRYIVDINLLNNETQTVYSLYDVLKSDYDYGEQEWFQEALQQEDVVKCAPPHGTDHLYTENTENTGKTFTLIYPIRRESAVIGYVVMEINLFEIAEFLDDYQQKDAGYVLLDEKNQVIFHYQDKTESGLEKGLPQKAVTDKSQDSYCNGYFYILRKLNMSHWTVVLECGYSIILKPILHLIYAIIIIGIITIVLVLFIIYMNARKLARPMQALVERIHTYDGTGSKKMAEYDDAPSEVTVIGEQFEQMADKMNGLIQEVYVAELQKKEAELEALMNQINPHFLYNVFQLIETKAVLADNREIEDMIQALSQMMRYTMERKMDMVKIQEELDYIDHFLMFYKVRFPLLFTYEIKCPDELLDCRMPKFILQPVVENCIKHAFDRTKTGGQIEIKVQSAQNDIIFTVWDNGRGIEPKRLAQVQNKLDQERYEGGIGVVNTNARIRLIYGEEYGIRIESEAQKYTRVILRIDRADREQEDSSPVISHR